MRKPGLKLVQNPGPKPGHSQRNLGLKLGPKLVRNPGLQPGPKKLHARNRGLPLRHAQRQNQRKSRKTESK